MPTNLENIVEENVTDNNDKHNKLIGDSKEADAIVKYLEKQQNNSISDVIGNAGKLTGGDWVTIGGTHIYVKDGKAIGGPEHIVKKLNEMKVDFSKSHDVVKAKGGGKEKETKPAAHESTSGTVPKYGEQGATVKKLEQDGKSYISKLEPTQKQALVDYTKDKYYSKINSTMRSCPPKFDCLSGKNKEIAESVLTAVANAPKFDKPTTLSRGMDLSSTVQSAFLKSVQAAQKSGKLFQLPSIISTSSDGVKDAFKGNIEMRITAKKGLSVKSISKYAHENEVLLHPSSKFKVVSVEQKLGRHVIHMEQQ